MKLSKYIILLILLLSSFMVASQYMSQINRTVLQDVNIGQSTITINGQLYKYTPSKKVSLYRQTAFDALLISDLEVGEQYYFEIKDNIESKEKTNRSRNEVVFISTEKLPE